MPRREIKYQPTTDALARDIDKVTKRVLDKLDMRLEEKGAQVLNNSMEAFGVLSIEVLELSEAIHTRSKTAEAGEWEDVAVAALFGLVSKDLQEELIDRMKCYCEEEERQRNGTYDQE